MSEMIERVAIAISDAMANNDGWLKKSYSKEDFALVARAALEAMREPTEAMKIAGSIDPGSGGPDRGYETEVWQEMIDAALQEN